MTNRALVRNAIVLLILFALSCDDDEPKTDAVLPERVSCTISESLYLSEVAGAI